VGLPPYTEVRPVWFVAEELSGLNRSRGAVICRRAVHRLQIPWMPLVVQPWVRAVFPPRRPGWDDLDLGVVAIGATRFRGFV